MKKTVQYLNGQEADKIVKDTLASYQAYAPVVKNLMDQGK